MTDDSRLIDIETRLAHQEHTLAELNEALSNQQALITSLERLCQSLLERVRVLSADQTEIASGHEKPPHY